MDEIGCLMMGIFWIGFAATLGFVNLSRGHDFIAGFGFSLLLSPIIALLIILARPENKEVLDERKLNALVK